VERQWLLSNLGAQYDATVGSVARVLSESPGLRTVGVPAADVMVDLVAVQLYLAGRTRRFDDVVRAGAAGPHVPLARCIASGLRRLPSHRGAALIRTTIGERELRWYGARSLVTEWGFAPCLTGVRFRPPGDVELLIWSITARRTQLLAPELPEQVVFLPGTSFKVLTVTIDGRPRVLLREVAASEVGADGRVDTGRGPLDEFALSGLTEAAELWAQEEPTAELPASRVDRFSSPIGLIASPTGLGAAEGVGVAAAGRRAASATGPGPNLPTPDLEGKAS
jgi:hypothetical protein